MTQTLLQYTGSAIILLLGAFHLFLTKSITESLGNTDIDQRRTFVMGWAADGFFMLFLAMMVIGATFLYSGTMTVTFYVTRWAAVCLIIFSMWNLLTGARTNMVFLKISPAIKLVVAAIYLVSTFI